MDSAGILAGLLRRLAVPPADLEQMEAYVVSSDGLIIGLALDKASVNWVIGAWCVQKCMEISASEVFPHIEPCTCHGVQTAKNRVKTSKKLSAAISSFSRSSRQVTFDNQLADAAGKIITSTVVRVFERRPEVYKRRADTLLQHLFADGDGYSKSFDAEGNQRVSQFITDIREYMTVVDIGLPDVETA